LKGGEKGKEMTALGKTKKKIPGEKLGAASDVYLY